MHSATPAPGSPTPPQQHRFHFLDLLRGIAAICVVPRHAAYNYAHAFLYFSSYLAVDFFFCLSGFVVAFSYEQRLADKMSLQQFGVTRLVRLYPLAFLGTLLGAIEFLCSHRGFTGSFITAAPIVIAMGFTLLPCPILPPDRLLFPLDAVIWTLFCELVVNAGYAVIVRRRMAQASVLFCIVLVALSILLTNVKLLDIGANSGSLVAAVARTCLSFFMGVLIYRFYKQARPGMIRGRRAIGAAAVLTVVLLLALCAPGASPYKFYTDLAFVTLLFPLIIYIAVRIVLPASWTNLCVILGTISYPLYILHRPLLWPLTLKPMWRFAESHALAADYIMVLCLIAITAGSWLIATFYDAPIRNALSAYFKKRGTPKPVLTTR